MENWIQIVTFTYPHEAHLVKGKLASEGIEVIVDDELTAQVHNFYSNAIGGVKLLVQEKDYIRANHILIESGYITPQPVSQNNWPDNLDRLTAKLPCIGNTILELRLLVLATIILLVLLVPIALLSIPI